VDTTEDGTESFSSPEKQYSLMTSFDPSQQPDMRTLETISTTTISEFNTDVPNHYVTQPTMLGNVKTVNFSHTKPPPLLNTQSQVEVLMKPGEHIAYIPRQVAQQQHPNVAHSYVPAYALPDKMLAPPGGMISPDGKQPVAVNLAQAHGQTGPPHPTTLIMTYGDAMKLIGTFPEDHQQQQLQLQQQPQQQPAQQQQQLQHVQAQHPAV
jgi:hypothetical protein